MVIWKPCKISLRISPMGANYKILRSWLQFPPDADVSIVAGRFEIGSVVNSSCFNPIPYGGGPYGPPCLKSQKIVG